MDSVTDDGSLADHDEVEEVYEPPGRIIGDRYRIERPLAHGGMGSVYLATQLGLQRRVAIKALASEKPELLERFRREAVALAEVSHPGVVEIYDFLTGSVETEGRCYLVMAYIDGVDLEAHLRTQPERRLQPQAVVELLLPVVSALVELHTLGIIHRDLKPANLVRYVRADGRAFAKLVDFGIARREVDPGLTATGSVLGTPAYLAPEAIFGRKQTPKSDVYSLGATLFELLTGAPPFGDGKPIEIINRVMQHHIVLPPEVGGTALGTLIVRMLEMEQDKRPTSLRVFETFESIAHGFGEVTDGASGLPASSPHRMMLPLAPAQCSQVTRRTIPLDPAQPEDAGPTPNGADFAPVSDFAGDPFDSTPRTPEMDSVDSTQPVVLPPWGTKQRRRPRRSTWVLVGVVTLTGVLGVVLALVSWQWLGDRRELARYRASAKSERTEAPSRRVEPDIPPSTRDRGTPSPERSQPASRASADAGVPSAPLGVRD